MERVIYKASRSCFFLFISICILSYTGSAFAEHQEIVQGKKVMVVASYHAEYKWVGDIIDSLKKNLQGAQLTFFYMDTKRNLEGAAEKATGRRLSFFTNFSLVR